MKNKEFEIELMKLLLKGDNKVLKKLREQYKIAKIVSREFSEVGFYIDFLIENNKELKIEDKTFQIGDVDGSVNGVDYAVGFILYIKDGYISLLEGYTNIIDRWPKATEKIILSYDTGKDRDINKIKKNWE